MSCLKNTIADFSAEERERLAVVALGSNLPSRHGSPAANLRFACQHLSALSIAAPVISSLWQTDPVDCPPGSQAFINAIVLLLPVPDLTAPGMLKQLQAIENRCGRERDGVRNAPRPLDLDLIAFGRQQNCDDFLILPHPRAHQRRFVLEPLAEIAPGYFLPGRNETVEQLLAGLSGQESSRLQP